MGFSSLFSSQSGLDGLENAFFSEFLPGGSANRASLKLILLKPPLNSSFIINKPVHEPNKTEGSAT